MATEAHEPVTAEEIAEVLRLDGEANAPKPEMVMADEEHAHAHRLGLVRERLEKLGRALLPRACRDLASQ